jgi:hypothetical protein
VVKKHHEIKELGVQRFPDLLDHVEDADTMIETVAGCSGGG